MGTSPQRLDTPRTGLEDAIAGLFENALTQASAPRPVGPGAAKAGAPSAGMRPGGNMANSVGNPNFGAGGGGGRGSADPYGLTAGRGGPAAGGGGAPLTREPTIQEIYTALSLPGYGGQLTAGSNPLQEGALDLASLGVDQIPGFLDLGRSVTSGLRGVGSAPMAPNSVLDLLTNRPGSGVLNQLASGGGAAGELMRLGQGGGAVGALMEQAGQSDRDFGGILDALNSARRGSLEDSLRDTQERFSASGLRFSTNLADSLGETSRRSDEQFLGLGASLLPQLTAQRQNALSTAGNLQLGAFQGAGGLGLGAGQTLQQGGLAAGDILGQLFQGQQNRGLAALQSLPGAAQLFANLPGEVARNAYGLGTAQREQETQGLQALYQEFLRTQGGFLAPILNFAAGAPQITGPGKGTQLLGAGTQLGGAGITALA